MLSFILFPHPSFIVLHPPISFFGTSSQHKANASSSSPSPHCIRFLPSRSPHPSPIPASGKRFLGRLYIKPTPCPLFQSFRASLNNSWDTCVAGYSYLTASLRIQPPYGKPPDTAGCGKEPCRGAVYQHHVANPISRPICGQGEADIASSFL